MLSREIENGLTYMRSQDEPQTAQHLLEELNLFGDLSLLFSSLGISEGIGKAPFLVPFNPVGLTK